MTYEGSVIWTIGARPPGEVTVGSTKTRSSNIELLRIMGMAMIIMYHIGYHCIINQLTDRGSMERMGNALFISPGFSKKLLLLDGINTLGIIGNVVFILISGYFMVGKGKNINLLDIAEKLLTQQGFAAIMLVVGSTLVYYLAGGTFIQMMNITTFNSMSWYVGYYFLIILLAYYCLNDYLSRLNQKRYLSFVVSLFAITQLSFSIGILEGLAGGLSTLCTGIFLYSLGGYIRKFNPLQNIKSIVFICVITVVFGLVFWSNYNATMNNVEIYHLNNSTDIFIQSIIGYGNNSIVVILIGLSLFELFRRLNIPNSRVINYIGASTLMTYLIHDNDFFYSIWNTKDWITLLYNNPIEFMLILTKWTIATFVAGVMSYTAYVIIATLCYRHRSVFFKRNLSSEHIKCDE